MKSNDDAYARLTLGLLVRGKNEPLELPTEAQTGLRLLLRLASLLSELRTAVETLLQIAYILEGELESPAAAAALRNSILESPEAMSAIETELASPNRSELKSFGKRLMRKKKAPVSQDDGSIAVRSLQMPTTIQRAARVR